MTGTTPKFTAVFFGLTLGFSSPSSAEPLCNLRPATTWYTTIFAGNYRMLFDDNFGPAPEGGEHLPHGYGFVTNTDSFRIAGSHGMCWASYEVGIVTMPVFIADAQYLYIPTYSGSDEYLFVVDAQTCKTLWQSPDLDGPPARTSQGYDLPGAGRVVIGNDCLPRFVSK